MIGRRLFLLSVLSGLVVTAGVTPPPASRRNELAEAANAFHRPYATWAERMNAPHSPGVLQADAVEAFQSLPGLWRKVEDKFRGWVRGR